MFRGADPADSAVQPGAGAAAAQGQGRVQVNRENCHFSLLFLEKTRVAPNTSILRYSRIVGTE